MCGIAGFVDFRNQTDESILINMTDSLNHRGPDDAGYQLIETNKALVGLGHRRLSILDLSQAGHQPMSFKNLTITFNGEVYNFREIRKELERERFSFRSDSDTEVILKAWYHWGLDCLEKFIGMFAFSIYDADSNELVLVRDRAGVKPLYYFWNQDLLLWGSELKALMQHPKFEKNIDKRSLGTYFQFGYVPSPHSIFENTFKVRPGEIVRFSLDTKELKKTSYWSAEELYLKPKFSGSYQEAKEELESLLKNAFNYRMVSDVPVGVFLSGGYDSTAVTALLQKDRTEKLKTFTIGFEEGNNETEIAQKTAEYLGTDHHEMMCTTREAQELITKISYHYDEPFADSSAIPTMLVSKFAKEYVTVALSADGGDEVFGGYNSYQNLYRYQNKLSVIPGFSKSIISELLNTAGKIWSNDDFRRNHLIDGLRNSLSKNKNIEGQRLFKWANRRPKPLVSRILNGERKEHPTFYDSENPLIDTLNAAFLTDYKMYLPGDILTKVDRATMSVSLEGREPLLDHRILEFASRLPLEYKFTPGSGKVILKDIVHDHVPKEWMKRPKTGFSIPMTSWLQGDLKHLLDDHVNERTLSEHGLFDSDFVIEEKQKFLNDKMHYKVMIWKVLMFQMWWSKWG